MSGFGIGTRSSTAFYTFTSCKLVLARLQISSDSSYFRLRRQAHASSPAAAAAANAGPPARARRPQPPRPADALAEVRQHDRQVVDIDRAVAGELALRPSHAGLAEVRQQMVKSLTSTLPSPLASPSKSWAAMRNPSVWKLFELLVI